MPTDGVTGTSAEPGSANTDQDTDVDQPAPKKRKRTTKAASSAATQNSAARAKDRSTPPGAPETATPAITMLPSHLATTALDPSPPPDPAFPPPHLDCPEFLDQVPPPVIDIGLPFPPDFDWSTLPPLSNEINNDIPFPFNMDNAATLPMLDFDPNTFSTGVSQFS
jgi:hypothetical protein